MRQETCAALAELLDDRFDRRLESEGEPLADSGRQSRPAWIARVCKQPLHAPPMQRSNDGQIRSPETVVSLADGGHFRALGGVRFDDLHDRQPEIEVPVVAARDQLLRIQEEQRP